MPGQRLELNSVNRLSAHILFRIVKEAEAIIEVKYPRLVWREANFVMNRRINTTRRRFMVPLLTFLIKNFYVDSSMI